MQKKLTITLDEQVYHGLHSVIGRRRISHFIETVVRPHVLTPDLDAAYRQMAQDESRETEAWEWAEATFGDAAEATFGDVAEETNPPQTHHTHVVQG